MPWHRPSVGHRIRPNLRLAMVWDGAFHCLNSATFHSLALPHLPVDLPDQAGRRSSSRWWDRSMSWDWPLATNWSCFTTMWRGMQLCADDLLVQWFECCVLFAPKNDSLTSTCVKSLLYVVECKSKPWQVVQLSSLILKNWKTGGWSVS